MIASGRRFAGCSQNKESPFPPERQSGKLPRIAVPTRKAKIRKKEGSGRNDRSPPFLFRITGSRRAPAGNISPRYSGKRKTEKTGGKDRGFTGAQTKTPVLGKERNASISFKRRRAKAAPPFFVTVPKEKNFSFCCVIPVPAGLRSLPFEKVQIALQRADPFDSHQAERRGPHRIHIVQSAALSWLETVDLS